MDTSFKYGSLTHWFTLSKLLICLFGCFSVPIKTLFEVDTTGIVSVTFSADAKYLATLGCTQPQVIYF